MVACLVRAERSGDMRERMYCTTSRLPERHSRGKGVSPRLLGMEMAEEQCLAMWVRTVFSEGDTSRKALGLRQLCSERHKKCRGVSPSSFCRSAVAPWGTSFSQAAGELALAAEWGGDQRGGAC